MQNPNQEKIDHSTVKIFSIWDKKSGIWSRPTFMNATGAMLRQWKDLVNDKSHPVGQHPEDYYLYQIGTWNENNGEIKVMEQENCLGSGLEYQIETPSPKPQQIPTAAMQEYLANNKPTTPQETT